MSFEVSALHIQDAFSDPARAPLVLNRIRERRPNVAIFTEAWHEGREEILDDVQHDLMKMGYNVVRALNDDDDGREDRHGMMGIVRNRVLTNRSPQAVRLGNRNALYMPLSVSQEGPDIDFYGLHLDDRSEARRLTQTDALLRRVIDSQHPAIVAGKFNAMYWRDPLAIALRLQRPFSALLPAVDPGPNSRPTRAERVGSLGQRLGSMASGDTMRRFVKAGFLDADRRHHATKGPFNLDRIIYRGVADAVNSKKNELLFKDQRTVTAAF